MWTAKPAPISVQFIRGRAGTISAGYSQPPPFNYDEIRRRFINIPTKSQTSESVGVLGQTLLLSSANSNSSNKPIPKEKEISGYDVLWAIQRVTAQRNRSNAGKKKKNTTKLEIVSSAVESTGDNDVDYSNVRPLMIKSDWGERLEEFENVLKEFREMEL